VAVTVVFFAYRYFTNLPTPQEALAERAIRLLPYQVFAQILARLQHDAKPLGLALAVFASVIGFGIGGMVYAWLVRGSRRSPLVLGLAAAVVTWLVLTYVFLPVIEGGLLGAPLTTVVTAPELPMGLASLAYGLVLALLYGRPVVGLVRTRRLQASGTVTGRREILRRSALVVLGAAAGTALAWAADARGAVVRAAGQAYQAIKGMPPEVTPPGDFYQVSKNFFDPTVDVNKWTLEVIGLVDKPLKLSLDDFKKAAPAVERYQTFECISNEVGGDLIGNAKWTGVRVKDILALAGVKEGATTIIWRAVDSFSESIPIDVAMDPSTMLAYAMNGDPIPQKHGAPVRVLIENRYGMKQPKWLTSIEVANHDYTGYWEQQGWSKTAIVKTNSAFKVETKDGAMLALGGWAFAGNRGISKVEVSPDNGKTWIEAAVKAPLGANTWQFWSLEWQPPKPGEYALQVRATDGKGGLQPSQPEPTLPDGGQGYHTVHVKV
jgi:DMSO/TMAO reductase YedYZ molybdopterin-dependent catalytic subunit